MGARTIIVGDIHGCYDELVDLIELLNLSKHDRVVAVGDLIVKGEKNREALELFMSDRRLSSVIGNHDLTLRRHWNGEHVKLKPSHKKVRKELKNDSERYRQFLNSLPFFIDLGTHLVVHAGLRPGVPLSAQSQDDLTQLRTLGKDRTSKQGTPWYELYDGEQIVLFGHWPARHPRVAPKAIGLDTGCVYGNRLTAYILEEDRFVSVPARRVYESPGKTEK